MKFKPFIRTIINAGSCPHTNYYPTRPLKILFMLKTHTYDIDRFFSHIYIYIKIYARL